MQASRDWAAPGPPAFPTCALAGIINEGRGAGRGAGRRQSRWEPLLAAAYRLDQGQGRTGGGEQSHLHQAQRLDNYIRLGLRVTDGNCTCDFTSMQALSPVSGQFCGNFRSFHPGQGKSTSVQWNKCKQKMIEKNKSNHDLFISCIELVQHTGYVQGE